MGKHTPGPWHSENNTTVLAGNKVIAYVQASLEQGHKPTYEQGNANAALIASAPELLAALKAILPVYKDWTEDGGHDPSVGIDATADWARIEAAEAAIAKAEGADQPAPHYFDWNHDGKADS